MISYASNIMHSAKIVQGSMRNHAGSATQPTTTTSYHCISDQLEQRLCESSSSTSWATVMDADVAPGNSLQGAASNSNGSFASTSGVPAASSHQADSHTPIIPTRSCNVSPPEPAMHKDERRRVAALLPEAPVIPPSHQDSR